MTLKMELNKLRQSSLLDLDLAKLNGNVWLMKFLDQKYI